MRHAFIDALAALIDEALRPDAGDPVFQGALQEYRHPVVREYLELRRQETADQRQLRTAINTVAHPAKPPRLAPGAGRESLARLHAEVSSGSWQQAAQTAQALLNLPQVHTDADLASALRALLDAPALARLQRLDALASDPRCGSTKRSARNKARAPAAKRPMRKACWPGNAASRSRSWPRARSRWRGIWTRRPLPNHAMATHRPATAW